MEIVRKKDKQVVVTKPVDMPSSSTLVENIKKLVNYLKRFELLSQYIPRSFSDVVAPTVKELDSSFPPIFSSIMYEMELPIIVGEKEDKTMDVITYGGVIQET